jgi:lysophospholipase L1-like esterase
MHLLARFVVLTTILTGFAVAAPRAPVILAAVPISRTDLHWWRARFDAKQAELHERNPALVFYGDSITQDWEYRDPQPSADFAPIWQRFYGDRNAVNLGFIGDTTASLLWRIEHGEASGIDPKVAVVLIGANNLGRLHWSASDTVLGIDTIIRQLRERLPHTKILLLGILPSDRSVWATETTAAVNRELASQFAQATDVRFLDVGHVFLRDGKLDPSLYLDPQKKPPQAPLHPTAQGQALMAAAMEPTLAALMGDNIHR